MSDKKLVNIDNLDKLSKGLDARYKEMIQNETDRASTQEQLLETKLNATEDMLGGRSIRYITQAEYDTLSEAEKNNSTIVYFITDAEDLSHEHENKDFLDNLAARNIAIGNKVQTFDGIHDLSYSISDIGAAPASHTHDDRYYTESEANSKFAPKTHNHDDYVTANDLSTEVGKLNTAINKKSDSGHEHDNYLTKLDAEADFEEIGTSISNISTQITGLQTSLAGKSDKTHNHDNDYAPKSHNHDDIYYTDDEVDNLLAGKSNSGHNHDDRYYTESEINTKIANLQSEIDTDVEVEKDRAEAAEAALQAAINGKAPSSHTHDDRYYTESEMNTKLAAKADTNHGTHVPTPQTANNAKFLRNDNSWQTVTPANIGAAPSSHNHNDSYYTKTEINTEIDNINETINTKEAALQTAINGKAPSSHNHDDRYYTETEMDGKLKTITDSISSNVSTLNSSIATAKSGAISESKSYTNTAIANLVDSAPEAMNTLNELAEAISNHKDDYDAYVSTVSSSIAAAKSEAIAEAAKKDTALHTTISAEIDADVKRERERAEAAESALQTAIAGKAPSSHTHDDRYYTESEMNTKLAGKADSSHGNHVPATETANNAKFLRNDNTWQTVTPANIGAAPTSHSHNDLYYTESEINTKISDINDTINTKEATLQAAINGKAATVHGNHASYGTCSTAAATAEKAVSVSANFSLTVGAIVAVKFTNSNTASNVTINVNSTGAKSIWYNTAAYTGNDKNVTGNANRITTYMYDGTYWVWISNGVDNNTTYTNASLGQGYVTCDTAAATAAKVASLSSYALTTGGMVAVKFTYAVPANATLNVNSKGAKSIYYRGAVITADIIKAGDIATFIYNGSQYHLISIDRWQNDLTSHNHDGRYYTESEIDTKVSTINDTMDGHVATLNAAIAGKAPSSHTHDDRYYTESEINTKLAAKADSSHGNHVPATQTASNKTFLRNDNTWATVTPANIGAAPSSHDHNSLYYTESEIDDKIEDINTTITNNVATLTSEINKKLDSSSHGAHLALGTTSSTAFRGDYGNTAYNHSQAAHAPSNAQKNSDITKSEIEAKLTGSITSHNHNGQYYTESEINTKIEDINETINTKEATLQAAINGKAPSGHNHNNDYAKGESISATLPATVGWYRVANSTTNQGAQIGLFIIKEKLSASHSESIITAGTSHGKNPTLQQLAHTAYSTYSITKARLVYIDESTGTTAYLEVYLSKAQAVNISVDLLGNEGWELITPVAGSIPANYASKELTFASNRIIANVTGSLSGNASTATTLKNARNITIGNKLNSFNGSADISYSISDIGAAPASHTHDDRYYTESEINTKIENINNTITTKEATLQAAINGKAPSSHNHTSVNKTMVTTPIYNASSGILVDFNIDEKSGAMVILKMYGNSYSTNPPIEAIYQFYDYAAGSIGNGTGSAISGPSIDLKVYRVDGKLKAWFQQPNSYSTFKLEVAYGNNASTPNVTLTNAAEPTTNITQTVTITPDRVYSKAYKPTPSDIGASASGHTHDDRYFTETEANNAFAPKSHNHDDRYYTESEIDTKVSNLESAINGKANSSHGTHVTWATNAPKANGTATTGSVNRVAREDHVHPLQTTISGNAGSATQLATGRAIKLAGLLSGQATFDGTADATITVSNAKPPKSGDWWSGGFATVSTDGVLEVGKYLDFHNTDASTNDYDVRLQANTSTPCVITLPTSTGTLALKTDKPEKAGVADSTKQSLTVQLNGGTTEGTNKFTFNGSTAKSVNITPSSIGASATGHDHNDSYYTKSQVDTSIAGITVDSLQAAPKTHTHNQINSRGNVTAETANNRPAVGGLSMSCAYNNGYPTSYGNVMTMKGTGDGQLLIGWSGTSGAHAPAYIRSKRDTTDANWSEWAQIYTTANKPSCNDIGAAPKDNTVATVSVSGGKLTLTKDKRQKCTNIISGTEIVFPTVSNTEFLEVHLYFNAESDMSLVLPDCKWRVDPNLEAGKSYELVATWNTMNWLANLIVYS